MVGGELLLTEVTLMRGKGQLTLTGQLGDVMQESIQAASTVVRSRSQLLGIPASYHDTHDMHIHVPEGATPKDGPSAGVAMCTALVSVCTQIPVRADVAMTGEITLRGRVLPVGGLKEKSLGAIRAKIKTVIVPDRNKKDLEDIPENIKKKLNYVFAHNMDDVLHNALQNSTFFSLGISQWIAGSWMSNEGRHRFIKRQDTTIWHLTFMDDLISGKKATRKSSCDSP